MIRRLAVAALITSSCVAAGRGAISISPDALPSNVDRITFELRFYAEGKPGPGWALLGKGIWSALGVTFDDNDLVGDPPAGRFTITSPPNVLSGDDRRAFEPVNVFFDPPVSIVGAWGFRRGSGSFRRRGAFSWRNDLYRRLSRHVRG